MKCNPPAYNGDSVSDWATIVTNPLSFNAGDNLIELESWDNYGMNIDYIFVNLPADAVYEFKGATEPDVPQHTHEFTDGVCACGAVKMETEIFEVKGTPASWAGEMGFYRGRDTMADAPTKIGAFGDNADNRIIVKFISDKAYTNITLKARIQTGSVSDTSHSAEIYMRENWEKPAADKVKIMAVNAGIGTWFDKTVEGLDIAEGENVMVIEAVAGCQIDWDYFVFETPEGSTLTAIPYDPENPDTPPLPEHTHEFTDGKCACGTIKIEAEKCEVTGTPVSWAGNDQSAFYRDQDENGNPRKVGAWGANGDNKILVKINCDKAYENVDLTCSVQTGGIVNSADACWVYLRTAEGERPEDAAIKHIQVSGGISNWTDVVLRGFNFSAGDNVLVFEACTGCEIDWDYFLLSFPADAVITVTEFTLPA